MKINNKEINNINQIATAYLTFNTHNHRTGCRLVPCFTCRLSLSFAAECQPSNNTLTERTENTRVIKHHRTVSLPTTGCPLYQEPLKIVHERTRSAPLTGDELDRVIVEKAVMYTSCKAINGNDIPAKKMQWSRRASTGARLSKLSPAHTKSMYIHEADCQLC